jgi:hypothetical protein
MAAKQLAAVGAAPEQVPIGVEAAPRGAAPRGLSLLPLLIAIVVLSVEGATRAGGQASAAGEVGGLQSLLALLVLVGILTVGFCAGYYAAWRAMVARQVSGVQMTAELVAKFERSLEKAEAFQAEHEAVMGALAQRIMPSARELEAAAGKLARPEGWYQEDFDPF